jgi:hypothetical protein
MRIALGVIPVLTRPHASSTAIIEMRLSSGDNVVAKRRKGALSDAVVLLLQINQGTLHGGSHISAHHLALRQGISNCIERCLLLSLQNGRKFSTHFAARVHELGFGHLSKQSTIASVFSL